MTDINPNKILSFLGALVFVGLGICIGILIGINMTKQEFSPQDWVNESQIEVYSNKFCVNYGNITWASYTDTKSMIPTFGKNANGIETKPNNPNQLKVGDIISYKYGSELIVHRITQISYDKNGWYAITKGDNNSCDDGIKVRFSQINGVLIALIY